MLETLQTFVTWFMNGPIKVCCLKPPNPHQIDVLILATHSFFAQIFVGVQSKEQSDCASLRSRWQHLSKSLLCWISKCAHQVLHTMPLPRYRIRVQLIHVKVNLCFVDFCNCCYFTTILLNIQSCNFCKINFFYLPKLSVFCHVRPANG